jgi:hypothetical protein
MVFPRDPNNPSAQPVAKGIQVVLQEWGLWYFHSKQQSNAKLPPLNLKCATCRLSAQKRDAAKRSAVLIGAALAKGYFLTKDQASALESTENLTPAKNQGPQVPDNTLTTCCWSKIMLLQSDFVNEKPLLQAIIEDAGHTCLFLPKFH